MSLTTHRAARCFTGLPLCAAALSFASSAHASFDGYGASFNYAIVPAANRACPSTLVPLAASGSAISVEIYITEDLTGKSYTQNTPGFGFQLNANGYDDASMFEPFEWQQYVINFESSTTLHGFFDNWWGNPNQTCDDTFQPGCWSGTSEPSVPLTPQAFPQSYKIPAGTTLGFELLTDDNDNVILANWSVNGVLTGSEYLLSFGAASTQPAPIYDLQLDIVGQIGGSATTFSSGAGYIYYFQEGGQEISPSLKIPTCSSPDHLPIDQQTTGEGVEQCVRMDGHVAVEHRLESGLLGRAAHSALLEQRRYAPSGGARRFLERTGRRGAQWSTYFAKVGYIANPTSVPPGTGIFAVGVGVPDVYSLFDTNGAPSADFTGAQSAVSIALQGQTGGHDRPYELAADGTVWFNSAPVGPEGSWPAWTDVGSGRVVPGFNPGGAPMMSIMGPSDTPWVVNGDETCDVHGNSRLYKWDVATSSWVQKTGCMKLFAEEDTCLLSVSLDGGGNSYLWTSSSTNISWTRGALLRTEAEGTLTTMAATGTGGALQAYFTDSQGDLLNWSGSCLATGTVSAAIPHAGAWNITAVARDWAGGGTTQNVYFVNSTALTNDIWQF